MKELFASAEQIFDLLNVTEGRRRYITRKLHSAMQAGSVLSQDQVYEYIANGVDLLDVPWKEKKFVRLDAPIKGTEQDRKPLAAQFAVTHETPLDLFVEEGEQEESISVGDALQVLGVDDLTLTKTMALCFGNGRLDVDLGLTENQVRQNADQIISRLEEVTALLYANRILVPRIVLVKFDQGLQIEYSGNLPSETIQGILDSHGEIISARKVAKKYVTSDKTVLFIWRQANLKPHFQQGKPPISEESQTKIYEGHQMGWGSYKTAKHAGVSANTVLTYWHKKGLAVREQPPNCVRKNNVARNKLTNEQVKEIVSAHSVYHGNVSAAYNVLPYNPVTIKKYWLQAGLPLCGKGQKRVE